MAIELSKPYEKPLGFETDYMKILYYDFTSAYNGAYNSFQYTRVCTIESGIKHVKINDGNEFTYRPNEFIILPPDSTVHMDINTPTVAIVYEISDRLIEDTINKLEYQFDTPVEVNKHLIDRLRYSSEVKGQFEKINRTYRSADLNKGFLLDLYSQELVYTLLKDYKLPVESKRQKEPVAYAVHYFKENLYNPSVTVKEIAFHLSLSPSNLIDQFKKTTGMTPKEYQNLLKINKAKEDLAVKNVSEVAYDLGFESISYFIKLFKQICHVTPKQYQLRHKKASDRHSVDAHKTFIGK
ncbi:MAG TPA: AraC family transcriptional regulator [Clostridiales bacterium UBA8960]|jgi:AraC-like DNA-binding protein|nr:AraC family transcriptional regulator [Clostridiales bacterium UBA8960]